MTFYLLPTKTLEITKGISKELFNLSRPKDENINGYKCNWWGNKANDFYININIEESVYVDETQDFVKLAEAYKPLLDLGLIVPSSLIAIESINRPVHGYMALGELIPAELFLKGKTHQEGFALGYRPKLTIKD